MNFSQVPEALTIINVEKARAAAREWASIIIAMEGEGDMAAAKAYSDKNGKIGADLQKDLDAIRDAKIPRDIVYKQGASVLGL